MASNFTTADRRKRIATYGNSSRLATKFNWDEDAPSPERTHKHAGSLNGSLKRPAGALRGGSKLGSFWKSTLQSPAARDVFDVPDDDELPLPASPVTVKKVPPKPAPAAQDDFDVPLSDNDVPASRRRVGKTAQPLRKPQAAPPPISTVKTLRKPDSNVTTSSSNPIAPPRRRAKTPQLEHNPENGEQSQPPASKRSVAKPKAILRATTPAPPPSATYKKTKSATTLPSKKTAAKTKPDFDEWDVPLSDEDVPILTPRKAKPAPITRAKSPTITRASLSPGLAESDDSNASRKRKRQGSSQSSVVASLDATMSGIKRTTVVPRGKRYQKKEDSISPGLGASGTIKPAKIDQSSINKPKRTRVRTAPGSSRGPVAKGQSSPAKLHNMLAVRSLPKPSPIAEVPEIAPIEDETMYDVEDPSTPIPRSNKPTVSGSVTPRQMQMFGNLLGESSDTTPGMPSIRRLQLTDRKPGSLVAGLARSSSDIPQSAHTRKTRLIDTLRQAETSSEEEDDSESDEETDGEANDMLAMSIAAKQTTKTGSQDEMEVEYEGPSQSQASQNALHLNNGSKVTYGQQRSYLEESNLEDGLLLSMDLDEALGLDGHGSLQRQESISEDDDDPASQVRGIHELRRQGFNQKFSLEAQLSIDEIAGKASLEKSLRRSALLEFCSQMADAKFLDQLLESSLIRHFLASIGHTGEIIFDFAASVAVAFILESGPGFTVLHEVHRSDVMTSLTALLRNDLDITRIAKDRKTNLSKIGRESVDEFRALVQTSSMWDAGQPDKVTPQIVALRALELLILALRNAGSTESLVDENVICKLLDLAAAPCERLKASKATAQDIMTLNLAFSITEAASISNETQATWSNDVLQRLVSMMTVFFNARGVSPIKLAVRLCVLLTNNKPKACELFAGPPFVQSLVGFISHEFDQLASGLEETEAANAREALILSLGAVINIAEFSDQARKSVASNGDELIDALAKTFLVGSEQAAQVCCDSLSLRCITANC